MVDEPRKIGDDDELYRRVAPEWVTDGAINSAAYSTNDPDGISVDLARLTTPEETRARALGAANGVGVVAVRIPRGQGLEVRPDPQPDNPAHCLIMSQTGILTRAQRRALAEHTRLLISPDPR